MQREYDTIPLLTDEEGAASDKRLQDAFAAFLADEARDHLAPREPSAKVVKRQKAAWARTRAMLPLKPRKLPEPPTGFDTGLF